MTRLRALLRRRVPKGYGESMEWGAISYSIPLEVFPDTYNGQPLAYAALASKKSHFAIDLMGAWADASLRKKLEDGFRRAGKKLDMGKACIRFRSLDDLPLQVIGDVVAAVPPRKYLQAYRKSRKEPSKARKAKTAGKA